MIKGGTIDFDNGADMKDESDCNGTERTVCNFNSFMTAVDPFFGRELENISRWEWLLDVLLPCLAGL